MSKQVIEIPEGFTPQEWYIGQVYVYLLWSDEGDDFEKWRNAVKSYRERFPEQIQKFRVYMGWDKDQLNTPSSNSEPTT